MLSDIAETIRTRRRQLRISQEGLAGLAECSRATIIAIESGSSAPRLDILLRVLTVLGLEMRITPRGAKR